MLLGPFKLNRVPLRRVNQSYVIATQTKVDISKVTIPDEINDEYFKRITVAEKRKKGKTADIFQDSDKVMVRAIVVLPSPFLCRSTQSVINARQIRRKSTIKCCQASKLYLNCAVIWAENFSLVMDSTLIEWCFD